jgi:hypothetical protein
LRYGLTTTPKPYLAIALISAKDRAIDGGFVVKLT